MRNVDRHRRRRRTERMVFGILAAMLLVMGGSLLFYVKGQGTEKRDCIGNVEFSLTEPLWDRLYKNVNSIQAEPGQKLVKDPTIQLEKHSKPAYLRVRILWGELPGQMREELEQHLSIKNGWVKNPWDGYYYYQYAVEGNQKVCFFDLLTVPENWKENVENVAFCMEFHVEAAEVGCIEVLKNDADQIQGWQIS